MEVILLERIGKLGQMGDVVRVKDGFARNFLLPHGKALRATKDNRTKFDSMKVDLEARNLEQKGEAEKVGQKLDGQSFTVIRQAADTGQLYGSVSPRDIVSLVTEQGFKVSRSQIALNTPIKTIGLFKVPVSLHPEVEVNINVTVARSADEAAPHRPWRGRHVGARRGRGTAGSRPGGGRGVLRAGSRRGGDRGRRGNSREERRRSLSGYSSNPEDAGTAGTTVGAGCGAGGSSAMNEAASVAAASKLSAGRRNRTTGADFPLAAAATAACASPATAFGSAGVGSRPAPSTGLRRGLDGLGVGPHGVQISRHRRSLLHAGRIMLPHERDGRALDLAWTAMAGVAGMGEDLGRRSCRHRGWTGRTPELRSARPPSPSRPPRSLLRWSQFASRPASEHQPCPETCPEFLAEKRTSGHAVHRFPGRRFSELIAVSAGFR